MNRVIFSLYIDIQKPVSHFENKKKFNDNYQWLLEKQMEYADTIGVEYKHFTYDNNYIEFSKQFGSEISEYNIINFYKMHLLYNLDYDEILYLDLDVIPVTNENFFEVWDLSKGIAIMSEEWFHKDNNRKHHSVRSPLAKYWNARAMLGESKPVFNTGIVGINKQHLNVLDYFGNFNETLNLMTELIHSDFWPDDIRNLFGYDNETIFAYKLFSKNLSYQNINNEWHYFMDKWSYIPKDTKFIHCINKDFNYVRNWCEKNNF